MEQQTKVGSLNPCLDIPDVQPLPAGPLVSSLDLTNECLAVCQQRSKYLCREPVTSQVDISI